MARILVVAPYPPRHCGIGAYARDQVARLRADGHEVTVLSPPDGDGDIKGPFLGGRAFLVAKRIGPRFDSAILHFQPALYFKPRAPVSKVWVGPTSGRSRSSTWRTCQRLFPGPRPTGFLR